MAPRPVAQPILASAKTSYLILTAPTTKLGPIRMQTSSKWMGRAQADRFPMNSQQLECEEEPEVSSCGTIAPPPDQPGGH